MPVTVTISSPADNADVPGGGTFMTYGTVSPTDATMSAKVVYADNSEVAGTPLSPKPGHDWTFRFNGIQTDEWVTLTVTGVDAGTGDSGEASHAIRCVSSFSPSAQLGTSA